MNHHCCACRKDGDVTADFKCPHCGSEDTFDKRLPEWPCERCKDLTALYRSVCLECSKELLGRALSHLFFGEEVADHNDDFFLDPREDFGDSSHRLFHGSLL